MVAHSKNSSRKASSAGRADSALGPAVSTTLASAQKTGGRSKKTPSSKRPRYPKKTSYEKVERVKKTPRKGPASLAIALQSHRRTREMVRMIEEQRMIRCQADSLILVMLGPQTEQSIHSYIDILILAMLASEKLEG
ncbi:hypothetical protein HOY82DRAFT_615365 [Tuber indicum]|nr:hypothetical protein HOY82DRAFT_615365 [Tuber indicum]